MMKFFAALRESVVGPKRRFVASSHTSGVGGEADMPTSLKQRD